jgi:hypothetical protein
MPFDPANHFIVSGQGIDGVIDIAGPSGASLTSVAVDGRALRAPAIDITRQGIVVTAIHEEVPDDHTLVVTLTIPQVNIDAGPGASAGLAVLTTERTSVGGPKLVSGPLHLYELRPLAVTASITES